MAAYLTFPGLKIYDELIKKYINNENSKSIKSILFESKTNKILFYKIENPTLADIPYSEIEIGKQDMSDYLQKIPNASEGNIVILKTDGTISDSSININDIAFNSTIGNLDDLKTDSKENIVDSINEIKDTLSNSLTWGKF